MKSAIGLDIGATTIKAVALSKQKNGFLLNAALISPTPPKGIQSGSPIDQEEMAKAVKKIIDDTKLGVGSVNLALPENQVYTRVIEMPVLSDKELSSAIYWEAEQNIPVPLKDLTLDWQIVKKPTNPEDGGKMVVLLVGAPTLLINTYLKIFSLKGIFINSIETEILSAIRALVVGQNFPNTLIINIGAVSTSIAIIKDSTIVFTYSLSTGGTAINRAIASDFGFTPSQAEEYKKVYGVSQKSLGGKIGQVTTPILMAIITEVKKALAFYGERYKNEAPIQQILLSGGTAKLPGIDLFFAQNCGVETAIANPWKVLVNQQVPKEILDNAPSYTIAVGLAMKDYE